jgi:hypothetical protein
MTINPKLNKNYDYLGNQSISGLFVSARGGGADTK